ncbi:hypothetical protein [Nonomuraea aridisoli]|uniref:hypothetical protein n=1 Tax=Nonomuraea aridisoli TaxID=2070368 RepID=UPI0015E8EA01|nr:hypothetical protein [Nonomuraea aridisoli]
MDSFHSRVRLSHHQVLISPLDEPLPAHPRAFPNGLIALDDDEPDAGATILTGVHTGVVDFTVQLVRQPPPPDLDSWDEIVEISLECAFGTLHVRGLHGDLPRDLPNLATEGDGWYRLRVHATGRDTDPGGIARTPTERYLLVVWPAPPQPELVLKRSDAYGAEVRAR